MLQISSSASNPIGVGVHSFMVPGVFQIQLYRYSQTHVRTLLLALLLLCLATMGDNPKSAQKTPCPSATGAWAAFHSRLRSEYVTGARRLHTSGQLHRVSVDGARLHSTFSSIFRKILAPRFRRSCTVVPADLAQHTVAASNYLARLVILQMAAVLRNKLESRGAAEEAQRLVGARPAVGVRQLVTIASLIETFGVFAVQERFHDRVVFVAQLAQADGRYGVAPESVSTVPAYQQNLPL